MTKARTNASVAPAVGRNIIINGAMNVSQRGTSLTMAHDGVQSGYLLDRFEFAMGANQDTFDGAYSQASDGPDGVSANSILWTTGTAESAIAADEIFYVVQTIEAQNCQRLGLGTSSSKQVTLSFYVKSSITGTYGVNVYKPDAAGDLTASIVTGTYTISSANTWERKTITFPSGTAASLGITDDNGQGLSINWHLAAGSTYTSANGTSWGNYAAGKWAFGHAQNGVATTAGATWFLTGVQLEVGPVATEFEQEDITTTLTKCQRYFRRLPTDQDATAFGCIGNGLLYDTASAFITIPLSPPMRTSAAAAINGTLKIQVAANADCTVTGVAATTASNSRTAFFGDFTCDNNGTAGQGCGLNRENDADASLDLSAEL